MANRNHPSGELKMRMCVLLVLSMALTALPAQADANDPFAALLDQQMPKLLAEYGVPGSVVAYIKDGDVAWSRAYGAANAAAGAPMRPDMLVEHGSNGKALTAWAVMKLLEQGKVDLDAPVNLYLKRWQVTSTQYDAAQVTLRRLLSHTAGMNIHGYLDYSPRRASTPDLTQVLNGSHLFEGLNETFETGHFSLGRAELVAQPGAGYKYSGAGYTVVQMVIEDVTGEPFAAFVQREITDPLGAASVRWTWTPPLIEAAAAAHGNEGQVLEYRQLANYAIGSEIATAADFARFVAAAVPGPHGEPIGRGVLKPESVQMMIQAQPGTGGSYGLGYGIATNYGQPAINHSGANSGWMAYYFLDTARRSGFVVASNSSRASSLHLTILGLWSDAEFGPAQRQVYPPAPRWDPLAIWTFELTALLALALLISAAVFFWQVRTGRRLRAHTPTVSGLLGALPWLLWLLFIWYTIYSPLPLYLPYAFPDFWNSPAVPILMIVLALWVGYRVMAAFFPRLIHGRSPIDWR